MRYRLQRTRTADIRQQPEPELQALASTIADPAGNADPHRTHVRPARRGPADEQLTVRVLPSRADEFTYTSCYLVRHNSRLADLQLRVCTGSAPETWTGWLATAGLAGRSVVSASGKRYRSQPFQSCPSRR